MAQPKTIFGHGSRCPPKQAREDRPARGNFWHGRTPGRAKNKVETMCFMRTLERERKSWRVARLNPLNGRLRFIDDEEPASLNEVWFTGFASSFLAACVCTQSGNFFFLSFWGLRKDLWVCFCFCDHVGFMWCNICALGEKIAGNKH